MFRQLLILGFITFANAIRVNLTGDDWVITDYTNYTVQGSVPGSIHTILLAAGEIPDPYLGENDVNLRDLVKRDWTFMKNFTLTPDILEANETNIHLEQIDTVANITINKCPIGQMSNMFRQYVFPVPQTCLRAENLIEIEFQSPVNYALEQSLIYNVSVPPNCPPEAQHGECHANFIRKEPCSFSWDWVSRTSFISIFDKEKDRCSS